MLHITMTTYHSSQLINVILKFNEIPCTTIAKSDWHRTDNI